MILVNNINIILAGIWDANHQELLKTLRALHLLSKPVFIQGALIILLGDLTTISILPFPFSQHYWAAIGCQFQSIVQLYCAENLEKAEKNAFLEHPVGYILHTTCPHKSTWYNLFLFDV